MNVLEVVQADHQPSRFRRPADRPVEPAKGFVKARPGYQPGQSHQGVVRIDDRLQPLAEQIDLAGWWAGWTHRKNTRKCRRSRRYRHFPLLHNTRESLKNKDSWLFSRPTKEMSASPADAQPVFDLICDQARALLGTNIVGLFEYDSTLVHYRTESHSSSFADPTARASYEAGWPRVPDRGSLSCRAILDGTIIHVRDMDAEPDVSQEVRALRNKAQISVPLMRNGRAIGAISTGSPRVDGISDTQVDLLKTFAE